MNRTGLVIALAIAVVAGITFGFYPQLELDVARYFHQIEDVSHNVFAWRIYPPAMFVRDASLWLDVLLIAPAIAFPAQWDPKLGIHVT